MKRIFIICLLAFLGVTTLNAQCPANTWTSRTSATDNQWTSVAYGNGLFVAVSNSGTGNRVMTSPDGITWTSRTSAADNQWTSVTYGNGVFVAVANTGTGNRVMTSSDGINWTIRTSAANNNWSSVTYGNNLFVAVANTGTNNRVMTSPNGINWTIRTSAANNNWSSVTYGNGLFVAVANTGTGNRVMTSTNGVAWTVRSSAADNQWVSVTYGNGLFVAVAIDGTSSVMTSPNGITWTGRTASANNNWNSVTFANGLFVAVAGSGTGNRVMTSPDGITWTSKTSAADNLWQSVIYGNGLFVAVSSTGTGNRVMTSTQPLVTPSVSIAANPGNSITSLTSVTFTATPTNGGSTPTYQWKKNNNNVGTNSLNYTDAALENGDIITCVLTSNDPCASPVTATSAGITMAVSYPCPANIWTGRTQPGNNGWNAVTFGNGKFVAVRGYDIDNNVMTSPDGINWTSRTSATSNNWTSVTYGNGLFVAVSDDNGGVMTSPDGITWTSRTTPGDPWVSVTYGNGLFVAVAYIGTSPIMTSPDGITWTSRTPPAPVGMFSVTYGNGLFVGVTGNGTGMVLTSPDGITWTIRNAIANTINWTSVTYGNGLFVAVSNNGTGNGVVTSPDGITWTSRTPAANNQWYSVTYGNGKFVAVSASGTGNRVMDSPDGINWSSRTSAADNDWLSVTYGNGAFVAVAGDKLGNTNNLTSNGVMTSSPPFVTPSVTIAANTGNSIIGGTSVIFTATPTNGGTTPTYQWKKNSNNVGSNSVAYTDAALANGDIITCVLTSNNPCASPVTVTSSGITMAVTSACSPTTGTFTTSACGSYTWAAKGNKVYTVSNNTDTIKLVNAGGCDSIVTLNLNIKSATTSTTNLSICPSQLPYSWNGSRTAAGTYTFTTTNSQGCDSVATLNLTVKSNYTITASAGSNGSISNAGVTTICEGNSQSYTISPNANYHIVDVLVDGISQGAITTYTFNNITANHSISASFTANCVVSTSSTTQTACVSYTWNSTTYTTSGDYTAHFTNSCGLDSAATLHLTINTATSSSQTASVCSHQLPYTWNGLSFTAAGTQTKTGLTNSKGCDSSATLTLSVATSSTPTVSVSADANNICSGINVTFTATATNEGTAPIYQWKKNGVSVGSGSSITFLAGTLANNDSVWCVLTSNSACATISTATSNKVKMIIKTSPLVSPVKSNVGVNITTQTMCTIGGAVTLYNTYLGGTWSSSNPAVATAVNGVAAGGASSSGLLTAVGNGTTTITYSLISSTNGCGASASATIIVDAVPTLNATTGASSGVCIGSNIALSNTSTIPAGGSGVWASTAGRATINATTGVVTGVNAGTGSIKYTITNASGCSNSTTSSIIVNSLPGVPSINYAAGTVNPQIGASFCNNRTFTLVGNPTGGVWSTTNAAVVTVTNAGLTKTIGLGTGSIVYTYTNANGCSSNRSILGNVVTCVPRGVNGGTNEKQETRNEFTMYPNPAKSFISLNVKTLIGSGTIVVTDLYGKQVKTQSLSMGTNTIDVSSFAKGIYFVSTITSEGKTTKKLVVE